MTRAHAGERAGRRRFGMVSATLAVAAVASGALFAGARGFGSAADAAGIDGRVGIGAPAELLVEGHGTSARADRDLPASPSPAPW